MAEESFLSWAYAGVNNTLAGNGGPECIAVVPALQRGLETILFTTVGLLEMYVAYPHIRLQAAPVIPSTMHRAGRRLLIAFMCLTFGIELGFKFATRQMIWILNPCHIVTMIQVQTVDHFSSQLRLGLQIVPCLRLGAEIVPHILVLMTFLRS